MDIYEQKDFCDFRIFGLIYLFVLLILLLINLIKADNSFINVIKKIGSYLFYITFCTLSHIFQLIFSRNIFIQFSISYNEIDYDFIFDVILFITETSCGREMFSLTLFETHKVNIADGYFCFNSFILLIQLFILFLHLIKNFGFG